MTNNTLQLARLDADGGWFPVLMAMALYLVLATWKDGRRLLAQRLRVDSIDLPAFLEAVFTAPRRG